MKYHFIYFLFLYYHLFYKLIRIIILGHAALTLRSRLRCIVIRKNDDIVKDMQTPANILVLNDIVIDRGPSPYLSNIDLFLDGKLITSVQGDGNLILNCISFLYLN